MTSLFLHATNVHQGGGKALLLALLEAVPETIRAQAQLDQRLGVPPAFLENIAIKFVRPSMVKRWQAEWLLARSARAGDIVLCFGNLPPLFKTAGVVCLFLQNRYLIDDVSLSKFSLKVRIRLMVERFWLKSRMSNVDEFVVQTPSMKKLLEDRTETPVRILPFMACHGEYGRKGGDAKSEKAKEFGFLYVASGEPHKNHRRLIEAWMLLAEQGVYPSLKLTLDETESSELCVWLREMVARHRLKIENLGRLAHEQVLTIYKQVGALIYPSTFESFGLPLIEARQAGLPILASELDYVRDVIDPEEVFDPSSDVSIARAVKRFMGLSEFPLPLLDAAEFLKQILGNEQ